MTTNTPSSSPSPEELLSSLLSSFGTLPPKVKKPKAPSKPHPPAEYLPLPQAFSQKKTGYRVWKAVSRVLQVQKQICSCCGSEVEYIKAEFFALENGFAHATWLRPEGYGIVAPNDLPITYIDLDPQWTTACPACRSTPFDDLESLFHPRQMELPL